MANMSDFALANIEALASDEDGGGYDSECQLYPEFSFVGKTYGKEEERIHKDRYYDLLVTYDVEYCTASGRGSLRGSNSMISRTIESTVEVVCNH